MKRLTIKLRITLWFTIFMILLSVVVFAFIALFLNTEATQQRRDTLTDLVDDNTRKIDYDDRRLEVDNDFKSFRDGVYCLVYYEDGEKAAGFSPYEDLEGEPFEDGEIRAVKAGGETYLIYDRMVTFKKHDVLWVRGVVLESASPVTSSSVYRAVLIALPLLVLLASVGGYLIARRSLRPIQKISQTAEDIGENGDLSKRIEMESTGDELHQLAGAFNRMFDRLETNFEAERNFTSDASHELRTPVATILAQCEYAFENASGEQELYEALGSIQKQGYRMSHIIESLLQFTRIEQRTEAAALEPTDLSALVLSVCREQQGIAEKDITLIEDIQPDITIQANMALMGRMLENLIGNASRYGKEHGSIHVGLREADKEIILSVADDGIGIAPGELPKIWNRFYRVDKSRTPEKGAGLGLGLAMVKQIAELHGGRAEVQSEPGRGSVFTVRLPKMFSGACIGSMRFGG